MHYNKEHNNALEYLFSLLFNVMKLITLFFISHYDKCLSKIFVTLPENDESHREPLIYLRDSDNLRHQKDQLCELEGLKLSSFTIDAFGRIFLMTYLIILELNISKPCNKYHINKHIQSYLSKYLIWYYAVAGVLS